MIKKLIKRFLCKKVIEIEEYMKCENNVSDYYK